MSTVYIGNLNVDATCKSLLFRWNSIGYFQQHFCRWYCGDSSQLVCRPASLLHWSILATIPKIAYLTNPATYLLVKRIRHHYLLDEWTMKHLYCFTAAPMHERGCSEQHFDYRILPISFLASAISPIKKSPITSLHYWCIPSIPNTFLTRTFFTLYHRNIPADDVRQEFKKFGPITDVWIARQPPGFAFVEVSSFH